MFGLIRDKWSLLVLNRLSQGPLRFSELRRRARPISQKMLTHSLRELERFGLVERNVVPATPPQVSYTLTGLGGSFLATVAGVCRWTIANVSDIEAAIADFEVRTGEKTMVAERERPVAESTLLQGRSPADHAIADLVLAHAEEIPG